MDRDRLVLGLASVMAGITVVLAILALVVRQPFLLFVALPFGVTSYAMWTHATGRLEERAKRRADAGGRATTDAGFGAGPRAGPRAGPGARGGPGAGPTGGFGGARTRGPTTATTNVVSRAEAYRTLGLTPEATTSEVRRAYRRRVKEVHPDTDGGNEEAFREVQRAYDRLSD